MFNVALYENTSSKLTKSFHLKDGKLQKKMPRMSVTHYQRLQLHDLAELRDLILSCNHTQAIGHGYIPAVEPGQQIRIADKPRFDAMGGKPGELLQKGSNTWASRTKDFFTYGTGPALIMFDYDPDSSAPGAAAGITGPDDLLARLSKVHPCFNDVGYLRTYSTSAGIYDRKTGDCLKPAEGMHVYVVVEDGRDIERFRAALQHRLWLHGMGWIKISKSGAELDRCLIDTAVFTPERLDFVAGAYLKGDRLEQRRPAPELKPGGMLDTSLIADLAPAELQQLDQLQRQHRRAKPTREKKRAAVTQQASEYQRQHGGTERDAVRAVLKRKNGELNPSDLITFDNGDVVAVSDLVKHAATYHGQTCYDPVYPEKGRGKAKFYANTSTGRPAIHSFVDGGVVYQLTPKNRNSETEQKQAWRDFCNIETVKRRYLGDLGDLSGTVLLRSAKGTGKTYTFKQWCDQNPFKSVLVLTHRQSLAWGLANRLNAGLTDPDDRFLCYLDPERAHEVATAERVVISLDSLHKIGNARFDAVIWDESEQGVRHYAGGTMGEKVVESLGTLQRVLRQAETVVCADADLGALTVEQLRRCRPGHRPRLIDNTYQTAAGRTLRLLPRNTLTDVAMAELQRGGSAYICTNSKSYALDLRGVLLHHLAGISTEAAAADRQLIYPMPDGRRLITITSDNSGDPETHEFIGSINDRLQPGDILITSPTIGTGVSIERTFDHVFFKFTGNSPTIPEDCSQQLFRVRTWNQATGEITGKRLRLPTDRHQLKNQRVEALKQATDTLGLMVHYGADGFMTTPDGQYLDLWGDVKAYQNSRRNRFAPALRQLLESEGYILENVTAAPGIGKETAKECSEERKAQRQQMLLDVELLDDQQYKRLRSATVVTERQQVALEKTAIARTFGVEADPEALQSVLEMPEAQRQQYRRLLPLTADLLDLEVADRTRIIDQEQGWTLGKFYSTHRVALDRIMRAAGIRWTGSTLLHESGPLDTAGIYAAIMAGRAALADMGITVREHTRQQSQTQTVTYVLKQLALPTKQIRVQKDGKRQKLRTFDAEALAETASVLARMQSHSRHPMRGVPEVAPPAQFYIERHKQSAGWGHLALCQRD